MGVDSVVSSLFLSLCDILLLRDKKVKELRLSTNGKEKDLDVEERRKEGEMRIEATVHGAIQRQSKDERSRNPKAKTFVTVLTPCS